jgi:hypothetical protein
LSILLCNIPSKNKTGKKTVFENMNPTASAFTEREITMAIIEILIQVDFFVTTLLAKAGLIIITKKVR